MIKIQIHLLLVSLCRKIMHHSSAKEIMNAAITIYIYDSEIYIIYHNMTIASPISQNFNINLVVFVDCIVISSWFFSNKWSVGFSNFGVGKRFLYSSFKFSFHHWKVCAKFCFFFSRFCFSSFSIEMIEKM